MFKLLYFPHVAAAAGKLALWTYAECNTCCFSVWFWPEAKAEQGWNLLVAIMFFFFRHQIEKIMTLIGAGIDFSRDQQYATPGTVLTSRLPVNGDGNELLWIPDKISITSICMDVLWISIKRMIFQAEVVSKGRIGLRMSSHGSGCTIYSMHLQTLALSALSHPWLLWPALERAVEILTRLYVREKSGSAL